MVWASPYRIIPSPAGLYHLQKKLVFAAYGAPKADWQTICECADLATAKRAITNLQRPPIYFNDAGETVEGGAR
jgi:hypothetical protein